MFAFLSDLRNHWRLEPHFLELDDVGARGGRVRIKGPLGLSRVARTAVESAGVERTRRAQRDACAITSRASRAVAQAANQRR